LGLPNLSWGDYKSGRPIPAPIILMLIEVTRVEARWLLHGSGRRYRPSR